MAYIGGTHSRTPLHVDKLNTVAFNIHVTGGGVKRWWMIDRGEKWNLEKLLRKGGGHLHTDDTWCDPGLFCCCFWCLLVVCTLLSDVLFTSFK